MQYEVKRSGDNQYIALYVKMNYTVNLLELSRYKNNIWYINRIIVHPTMRKQGIATSLMHELIKLADREEYYLFLEVNSYGDMNNDALKVFFTRFGFTANGLVYTRKYVDTK